MKRLKRKEIEVVRRIERYIEEGIDREKIKEDQKDGGKGFVRSRII